MQYGDVTTKRAREGENQSSNVVDPDVDQDHTFGVVLEGNQSLCCELTSSQLSRSGVEENVL